MTTSQERWPRVLTALGASGGPEPTPAAMCSVAADLLGAAGAGLLVMAGETVPGATYTSSPMAATLEDLQFTLGIGPRVDAYAGGVPIFEPDLEAAADRWIGFATPAVAAGARSVLSVPLRVGAVRVGAITAYRAETGPLADGIYDLALVVAEVVTGTLLAAQGGLAEGILAVGLRDGGTFDAQVHQATGMVSVQLGVGVGEALARLRARAFGDGVDLAVLAARIVSRRLRLEDP